MKSIAFIIPYFGKFPFWMDYFLESCRANPTVNFLFYSDNPKQDGWPENIIYKEMTFSEYKRNVSKRLNINFNPVSAYKVCDIRPAFPLIHEEDLKEFDFWGFCDIDLIFGDVRHFMTDEVLSRYDFISAYERRVSGHFFLCRNLPKYKRIYLKTNGWKFAFEDDAHHCFDEKAFSDLFIKFKNHPKVTQKILRWVFLPYSRKAFFKEQYSTPGLRYNWVDGSRSFPTEWYWNNGKLTNNGAGGEFLYFHFLKWKREWGDAEAELGTGTAPINKWKITRKGFEFY